MPELYRRIQELNKQIFACESKVRGHARVTARLQSLEIEIARKGRAYLLAKNKMEKEKEDVVNFDDFTLFGFPLFNQKKRDARLNQEFLEFKYAKFTFNAIAESLLELKREQKDLKRKLEKLPRITECVEQLYDEKAELLKMIGGKAGKAIIRLDKKIVKRKLFIKEMREAMHAGENAIEKLSDLHKKLKDITLWGLFSGSVVIHDPRIEAVDIPKNKKMYFKKLENDIFACSYALDKFEREFEDVYPDKDRDFDNLDEILTYFLEIFFHNFVTDVVVQSELRFSTMHVENVVRNIRSDIAPMEKHIFDSKMAIEEYEKMKKKIIGKAKV